MKASSTIEITPLKSNSQEIGGVSAMFKEEILCMATKRVLIIDDEPDLRAVVQGCLEDIAGWDVVPASSGQEGLAKVRVDRPDAIVLDVTSGLKLRVTLKSTCRVRQTSLQIDDIRI